MIIRFLRIFLWWLILLLFKNKNLLIFNSVNLTSLGEEALNSVYIFILYGRPTSWQELLKQTCNTRLVAVWISPFFRLTHNWRFTSWRSAWNSTLLLRNHSNCNSIFLDIFLLPRLNTSTNVPGFSWRYRAIVTELIFFQCRCKKFSIISASDLGRNCYATVT